MTCSTAREGREGRVSSPDTARPPTLSTNRERDKFLMGQNILVDKKDIVGQVSSETNSCLDKINSGKVPGGIRDISWHRKKFIAGHVLIGIK